MFFLNLTAVEFFALFGAVGGLVTALYLLDRSKRKKVVSTLRFWTAARAAEEMQSRRRMREPWSLLLQLLGLVLLLLAIGQLQWGSKQRRGQEHVLLLDTSAWSAAQSNEGTVLEAEKRLAHEYLSRMASADRVMVVRADALATPATPFTGDRLRLAAAIDGSSAQSTALNWEQALAFAAQAQSWGEGARGEIVYLGAGMLASEPTEADLPANVRALLPAVNRENIGIRRLAAKRAAQELNSWDATVTLKNYGAERRVVRLETQFAGTRFAARLLTLAPREETAAEYSFVTKAAGELVARLVVADSLASDNQARLSLPKSGALQVAVYTRRAEMWKPLLEANHRLAARFFDPAQYAGRPEADVEVLDGFAPPEKPSLPALWIAPPRVGSPIAIKGVEDDATIESWHGETPLANGLHAKHAHIAAAEVFETYEGDTVVASTAGGPTVVARSDGGKTPNLAVIGFDPLGGPLRFEVTTPILFANLLRWLSPESFRTVDVTAGGVGTATLTLDAKERSDQIRVRRDDGLAQPFTVRGSSLQIFTSEPSVLQVLSGERERILSLTLPDVAEVQWKAPAAMAAGLPARAALAGGPRDLWKWLAAGGMACLLGEWLLYGQQRRARRFSHLKKRVEQPQPELVAK